MFLYSTTCASGIAARAHSPLSTQSGPSPLHQRAGWVNPGPSAAPSRLDRGDVDFRHIHHRIKRAFGFIAADRQRPGQHARRDLPGDAPFVLAPAAGTFLAAIADDGVPVAVRLFLIVSGDLE